MTDLEEHYYRAEFNNTELYKLREDGHIFKFDFSEFFWEDVSCYDEFDISWEPLSYEEITQIILDIYENYSFFAINKYIEENDKEAMDFGNITYYCKKGDETGAVDDKGNNYLCHAGLLEPVERGSIDETWIPLRDEDVIDTIKHVDGIDKLERMNLYIDDEDNVQAIIKDSKGLRHYRVSDFTGHMLPVYIAPGEVQPTWRKVSYNEVLRKFDEYDFEESVLHSQFDGLNDLFDYIVASEENLKQPIGEDLVYFDSGYCDIYAIDENSTEYILHQDFMEILPEGTIDTDNWKRVKPYYVLEYVDFYAERKDSIANGEEVTLYDVHLFMNGKTLWGETKEGVQYKLNSEGDFVKLENESFTERTPVEMTDAVQFKSATKNQYLLNKYIDTCEEDLKEEDIEIDDELSFFCDFSKDDIQVYLKDGKGQEFLCEVEKITPVQRGTINQNYQNILDISVLPLIRASYENKKKKEDSEY